MARRNLKSAEQINKNLPGKQTDLFGSDSLDNIEVHLTKSHFLKYGWDVLGIFFITAAFILLLGMLNISEGTLITPLSNFFKNWFGVGRFLIVLAMAVIGIKIFDWRKNPPEKFPLGRILALEASGFAFLALLSIIQDEQIITAESNNKLGGMVGWGVAEIFRISVGPTIGFIIISVLLLIFLFIGFNILSWLEQLLRGQVDRKPYDDAHELSTVTEVHEAKASVLVPVENKKETLFTRKTTQLPSEFRKSFESPMVVDEISDLILERSKDLPPLDLLQKGGSFKPDKRVINQNAGLIEKTLAEFGIPAKVVGVRSGPSVTQFAVEPGYIDKSDVERQKIRISQISSLRKDLALALSAERLRIEAPVPGKSYVGIEIPNPSSTTVQLRPLLESKPFGNIKSSLALAIGRDVSGRPVVSDLATMPHMLIAGTTGSGKSVCITAITACLVMNNSPEDLKLAMIDPKRVELMRFNGLPHLMGKVETEIDRILVILRWATTEMDNRYMLLEKARSRNIDTYNKKFSRNDKQRLPKIVILIDELADLMLTAPDETEHAIIRLAQKSRAVGIHLILATQRPSTDVVTGLVKANFPTRISFAVASSIDSRVILDTSGAETLLGKGDMLFLHPEIGQPLRAQGAMINDKELERIINWWKKNEDPVDQPDQNEVVEAAPWEDLVGQVVPSNADEFLVEEAIKLIKTKRKASVSFFQRQLQIGFPRAARLVDQLEEMGILGPSQSGGREREIFIDTEEEQEF